MAQDPPTQIAFVDTPGLHRPVNPLGRALVEAAKGMLHQSDVQLIITDATTARKSPGYVVQGDDEIFRLLETESKPRLIAINKIDQTKDKSVLLPILEAYAKRFNPNEIIPISALKGSGIEDLITAIRRYLPHGATYAQDFLTNRPIRFLAAEFVREAAIRHTRDEVPHAIAVVVDTFNESSQPVHMAMTLVVERISQKKILIGKGGSMLKKIGIDARKQIEKLVGQQIYLELWVKVIEDWTKNPRHIRELVTEST